MTFLATRFFFLLDAAWVKSRAERPSVSYTKVTARSQGQAVSCNCTNHKFKQISGSNKFLIVGDSLWILALGLAALRLAVNLACFTKTRVCSSCFGSTNSGTRLFTKTQICLSCFGSQILGTLQVLNLRTAFLTLMFGCAFFSLSHPLISSSLCTSAASMEPLALLGTRSLSFDASRQ